MKRAILYELHDSPSGGHPSAKRNIARVVARFYFPDMIPFVSKYVEECTTCNRVKALGQPRAPPDPLPVPPYPWHTVGLDFVTNLPMVKGYDSMLVTVDHLTRMAHFTPCRCDITSKQTADVMIP